MAKIGSSTPDFNKERQTRSDLLKKQFAGQRRQIGAAKGETQRQSKQGFDRLGALVGATGGALEKARQKETQNIGRQFADVQAGAAAQEAQAQQALEQEISGKELAVSEAEKGRALQKEQFARQMAFQENSFAQQFAFQMQEFDENKRTNLINSIIALDAANIRTGDSWDQLAALFGGERAGEGAVISDRTRGLVPGPTSGVVPGFERFA